MNLLRRRWSRLAHKLTGTRAFAVLVLACLIIVFLLAVSQRSPSASIGDLKLSLGSENANKKDVAALDAMRSPPPAPPITPSSTSKSESNLSIPRKIHHYFGDAVSIPMILAQAVNSWANNHKHYNAYFWDSRFLEARLLPSLALYRENSRCYNAERPIVARLLLLLSQGGVLADPDLMSLRSGLDNFLDGSTCVLSQEPSEVAVLMHGLENQPLPSLRFAACRPDHPFMRLLLKNFCRRVLKRLGGSGEAASQRITSSEFASAFEDAVEAYDDSCTDRLCDHRDRIVLAEPGIFLPLSPSRGKYSRLGAACMDVVAAGGGSQAEKLACSRLHNPPADFDGRLTAASLAKPMMLTDEEEIGPRVRLHRIGPNVGRAAIANWLLTNENAAAVATKSSLS